MKILFAGTPDFAARSLDVLVASEHEVVAVLTRHDRPSGRGRKLVPAPVKVLALEQGIEVYQPHTLRDPETRTLLQSLDADVMVVVAYGLILPPQVLEIPPYGCLNIHASLLPRWRGAAPIQRAVEAGDTRTGISIMQMDAGLDTGDVLATRELAIDPADTAASLHDKLAELGAGMITPVLDKLGRGELRAKSQDESRATYAARLQPRESEIEWARPGNEIVNMIHAFNPWPGAKTTCRGITLKFLHAEWVDSDTGANPGTVSVEKQTIRVQTGNGQVRLLCLQKPGGRPMDTGQFLNGFRLGSGERFG